MKSLSPKVIVFACTLVLVAAVILTCNALRGVEVAPEERGVMNIDIKDGGMVRSGKAYETYQVTEGQQGIITVQITRTSGKLDVDIYPEGRRDKPAYTGRSLDSAVFDVIVAEPGVYKVCITAKDFVGDYAISWRTVENKK